MKIAIFGQRYRNLVWSEVLAKLQSDCFRKLSEHRSKSGPKDDADELEFKHRQLADP
jgi:hypothetical protein